MATRSAFEILHNPDLNKGTAFTIEERDRHGLEGLLPPVVETLEQRINRAAAQCDACANDLARYIYLSQLQDTDRTLFYALIVSDPNKYMPLVYTPPWVMPARSSVTSSGTQRAFSSRTN